MPFDMLFRFCTFWTCRDSLTMSARRAKKTSRRKAVTCLPGTDGEPTDTTSSQIQLTHENNIFRVFQERETSQVEHRIGSSFWISNAYPSVQ